MGTPLPRSLISRFRSAWTAPFHYSTLLTATLLPKLLHLYTHRTSLPCLLVLLYLPTFLALDVVNAAVFWALVQVNARRRPLLGVFRTLFSFLIVGASSLQIAFYLETGGEIKWGAATSFPHDAAGLKLLLSGSLPALLVAVFIFVVARIISNPLYSGTEAVILVVAHAFEFRYLRPLPESKEEVESRPDSEPLIYGDSTEQEPAVDSITSDPEDPDSALRGRRAIGLGLWIRRALLLAPIFVVLILLAVRPPRFPYAHMSASIPYTLLDIWNPSSQGMCQAGSTQAFSPFPLPELISPEHWEQPRGKFVGWMPSLNASENNDRDTPLPSWLPDERIPGFDRWYHRRHYHQHHESESRRHTFEGEENVDRRHYRKTVQYNPVSDPMRISNLDSDILSPIAEAIKETNAHIKHVVILSLESTRKDVFPLKKGSHMYDAIMKSHRSAESAEEANLQLANLTVNAELLTGESSGFEVEEQHTTQGKRSWRNLAKDKGGLNVVGAFTGSTSTFKSMIGSHCGVQPLPVDFTVEAGGPIYQPCLPAIFRLFNHNKKSLLREQDQSADKERPWKSIFVQSITDKFDRQDELNRHIGFSEVITKEDIVGQSAKYPPTEPDSNYFGLPESQARPYLRDIFRSAQEKNERLFLSHFTSSTHHPWNTPPAAGKTIDYLQRGRWGLEHSLNRYLNTVKYDDNWIGEIMDMIDEFDMADETLVVMVGDHGYAFEEDCSIHSTYENGHISNLRVPLVFHHPTLPRIQLAINATSLSIVPTILDLLIATSSLNDQDLDVASSLIHQYEGQSLIRPFLPTKSGRQQWNVGVLNAGGAFLSVSSAAVPFRLVLPICKSAAYRFTDTNLDPNEVAPVEENSMDALAKTLQRRFGDEAANWAVTAEKVGKWWVTEQRRRWGYDGASLQDDRDPNEMAGVGTTAGKHWWET
ncbi:alkaline-phosphatase-like protein [Xylogone sp. PMI_703]|nr:alkaline-phosphatase-like protein [Xylogone sp. PMI_703]